jgi:hypothetical protein
MIGRNIVLGVGSRARRVGTLLHALANTTTQHQSRTDYRGEATCPHFDLDQETEPNGVDESIAFHLCSSVFICVHLC